MPKPPPQTTVRASVDAELRKLKATTTVEGRTAQRLADLIDGISSRDAAPTVRELREVMTVIREKARETATSPLAGLRASRRNRRADVIDLQDRRERHGG